MKFFSVDTSNSSEDLHHCFRPFQQGTETYHILLSSITGCTFLYSKQGFRVVLKNEDEKSPSTVLVCIHIFISGSIISSAERKVVDRKSP
jgi:hypothetical protein